MKIIPIQSIPNQHFSFVLDNNQWDFTLKTTGDQVSASILLNGIDVIDNTRCVAGGWIIPSEYQESGNFTFITLAEQIPDYTQFGVTQYLAYYSAAELAAARVPPTYPITAADFNPYGALPLRFSPQGYTLAS